MSTRAASIRRSFTTTTAANGSSTWSGTIATPAGAHLKHPSILRHRAAGMGRRGRPARRTPKNIFAGSPHGLVEGPHLFKRDGWYYLTDAEGGTGYDHAVTMARSRKIEGPYELHPSVHLLTVEGRARGGAAARRTWPDRRNAGRTGLSHPPLLAAAEGREALAARARDRDPEMRLGRRRLALPRERRPGSRSRGSGAARRRRRAEARAPTYSFSPDAGLPLDFQWLRSRRASVYSRFPQGPAGCVSIGTRIDRLVVRAGAGRAAPGALRLSGGDGA